MTLTLFHTVCEIGHYFSLSLSLALSLSLLLNTVMLLRITYIIMFEGQSLQDRNNSSTVLLKWMKVGSKMINNAHIYQRNIVLRCP